jgi:glycine dehydrogenase subunit 2
LPIPRIEFDGEKFYLDYDKPNSVGKMRCFYGNVGVLLRAFGYITSMGAEGLEEVAEVSVLNANYLLQRLKEIRGIDVPYAKGRLRKHECVVSVERMFRETGIRAQNVSKRILDFGMHAPTTYFPQIVKEALMVEPTEAFEKEELDRFVEVMRKISKEAYSKPEIVLNAPENTAIGRLDEARASHPKTMALSWRMHLKKKSKH